MLALDHESHCQINPTPYSAMSDDSHRAVLDIAVDGTGGNDLDIPLVVWSSFRY